MNYIKDLPTFTTDDSINVVIEIPRGTKAKYEVDKDGKTIRTVRFLEDKYRYIFNYGSIPRTLASDGDMMDAVVVCEEPLLPGTVIECDVVAMIRTIDNGEQDDKVICIPVFDGTKFSKTMLRKIRAYLKHYKAPEKGTTQILETTSKEEAIDEIIRCGKAFVSGKVPATVISAKTEVHTVPTDVKTVSSTKAVKVAKIEEKPITKRDKIKGGTAEVHTDKPDGEHEHKKPKVKIQLG